MKSATTVVALVLTLLVWVPVASEGFMIIGGEDYSIATPAPDGQASCTLFVGGTNPKGTRATLDVGLDVISGEAQIPELGVADGFQDGCDIFPEGPRKATDIPVKIGDFMFIWTLEVHAHPDADCTASGVAEGEVGARLRGVTARSGAQVDVILLCE